jgi:hypothetical protein
MKQSLDELNAMPNATAAVFYVDHLAGVGSVRHTVGGRSHFRGERSHERWLQVASSIPTRARGAETGRARRLG